MLQFVKTLLRIRNNNYITKATRREVLKKLREKFISFHIYDRVGTARGIGGVGGRGGLNSDEGGNRGRVKKYTLPLHLLLVPLLLNGPPPLKYLKTLLGKKRKEKKKQQKKVGLYVLLPPSPSFSPSRLSF